MSNGFGRGTKGGSRCGWLGSPPAPTTSASDDLRHPQLGELKRGKESRDERPEIGETIRVRSKDDDRDRKSSEVLLERQVPVDCHKNVELLRRQGQQLA